MTDHGAPVPLAQGEEVDVADRLLAPSQAAGHLHPLHPWSRAHVVQHSGDELLRLVDEEPTPVLPVVFDGPDDLLGALLPESRQPLHLPPVQSLGQTLHGPDVELLEEPAGLLGSDALQAHQLHQRPRELGGHLLETTDTPRLQKLGDVSGDVLADGRQRRQILAFLHHQAEGPGQPLHRSHGVAVRADPEGIGSLDLQEIRQLFKNPGDVQVLHQPPGSTPAWARRSSNSSSVRTVRPSSRALASFEPASAPATT